nr:uncharacterized protein LOC129259942 [Lytechinus pictus]
MIIMDICIAVICLFGIVSSATGLRCYQCTSDQSGSGPCADPLQTDNMQVVEDCKGTCYVSYSQSGTSRGCYSRTSFCLETCLGLDTDINDCQHCCDCDNCNAIAASKLESSGDDYNCVIATPPSTTTTTRSPTTTLQSTTMTTAVEGVVLPRSHARGLKMSLYMVLLSALVASVTIL